METKCILCARDARQLLRWGCKIVDIKPKKEKENETIFIFECDDVFNLMYKKLNK